MSGSVARCSTYSPGPSSFTIDSETSANRDGSALRRLTTKSASARRSGSGGNCVPSSAASATMRSQRFGARTTRRIDA
jgi:hypothetical protein